MGRSCRAGFRAFFPEPPGLCAPLETIYQTPLRVCLSFGLHLAAWIAGAGATWIAVHLIGLHTGLRAVIALESLVYATRSAAFAVPNALGVQEAAYSVLAPLLASGRRSASPSRY
jgi:hypothetical protein